MDEKIKLFWIGISSSDIEGIEYLFDGMITIIGNNSNTSIESISLEMVLEKRINYNNTKNSELINKFLFKTIKELVRKYKKINFFWHDQLNFSNTEGFEKYSIYNNKLDLINYLCDKAHMRNLISRNVKVIPSFTLLKSECTYKKFKEFIPNNKIFVCQEFSGSGGNQTIIISSEKENKKINNLNSPLLLISGYIRNNIPINQHIIITKDDVICLPFSIQIIEKSDDNKLLYKGADFSAINVINEIIQKQIYNNSKIIGNLLKANGYLGVAGIDYITNNQDLFFVEINPRFQSSTKLLNKNLLEQNLPSIQELHISAFTHKEIILPNNIKVKGSILYGIKDSNTRIFLKNHEINFISPETRESQFSNDSIKVTINTNNLNTKINIEKNSRLFNIYMDRQIIHYNPYEGISINYAIESFCKQDRVNMNNLQKENLKSIAKFKFELFSHGLYLTEKAKEQLISTREDLTIRDGIAGGLEIILFDDIYINVPIKEYFTVFSPYKLEFIEDKFYIVDEYTNSVQIQILPIPEFVGKFTTKGTPMVEVGQMMSERLSLEIYFGCINSWKNETACKFCELGAEKKMFFVDPQDIREVIKYCITNPKINMNHILIGGGTPPKNLLYRYVETVRIIKEETNLSTYIMMAPPEDLLLLNQLKEAGLNEIGFNLEIYDRNIAKEIMPKKGLISKEYYFEALKYAVKLFGNKGEVRSILIVGIEPIENTLQAVKELVSIGVMPILSPFRPIPNTPMQNHPLPSPQLLYKVWIDSEKIVNKYNMCLGPLCIACQNNTIAIPTKKEYRYY